MCVLLSIRFTTVTESTQTPARVPALIDAQHLQHEANDDHCADQVHDRTHEPSLLSEWLAALSCGWCRGPIGLRRPGSGPSHGQLPAVPRSPWSLDYAKPDPAARRGARGGPRSVESGGWLGCGGKISAETSRGNARYIGASPIGRRGGIAQRGRVRPSFLRRDSRVVGLRPSSAAAPPGPRGPSPPTPGRWSCRWRPRRPGRGCSRRSPGHPP